MANLRVPEVLLGIHKTSKSPQPDLICPHFYEVTVAEAKSRAQLRFREQQNGTWPLNGRRSSMNALDIERPEKLQILLILSHMAQTAFRVSSIIQRLYKMILQRTTGRMWTLPNHNVWQLKLIETTKWESTDWHEGCAVKDGIGQKPALPKFYPCPWGAQEIQQDTLSLSGALTNFQQRTQDRSDSPKPK